jgi:hypothetical protein
MPGQVISVDQLESPVPGFIPITKGCPTTQRYVAATVFCDHSSGLTYVALMTSLSGEEMLKAKQEFENFADKHGVCIQHYHCDNGRFTEKMFMDAIKTSNQTWRVHPTLPL